MSPAPISDRVGPTICYLLIRLLCPEFIVCRAFQLMYFTWGFLFARGSAVWLGVGVAVVGRWLVWGLVLLSTGFTI